MGLYVNPTNTTKEKWLLENVVNQFQADCDAWLASYSMFREQGAIPVVLVDNGPFTALAVAYSREEAADFARKSDTRLKIFGTVLRDALSNDASGVGEDLLRAYKL
jgi:hypothetical protein